MNFLRTIRRYATKVPTNLKGKKKSSQEWLTRQLADPYVERAKVNKKTKQRAGESKVNKNMK